MSVKPIVLTVDKNHIVDRKVRNAVDNVKDTRISSMVNGVSVCLDGTFTSITEYFPVSGVGDSEHRATLSGANSCVRK